jgi:hypothetical protein
VRVRDAHYELANIDQPYLDRADCENGVDEIENLGNEGASLCPLGRNGYSAHDIERHALSARAVALVYNWWSWYVRLAHPKTRPEAITSRPEAARCGGLHAPSHGGQKNIVLTTDHNA